MTSPIEPERLRTAVEDVEHWTDQPLLTSGFVGRHIQDKAHFAARLIELEPWAEKAREMLKKNCFIYRTRINGWGHETICSECLKVTYNNWNEEPEGHAPDCALAELLKED